MQHKRLLSVLPFVVMVPLAVYYFAPGIRARVWGAYTLHANPAVVYTVELEDSLMRTSNGELSVVDKRVVARRSDGSKVFSHGLQGGNTPNKHRRVHAADGLYITVKAVSKSPVDRSKYWLAPGLGCQVFQKAVESVQPGEPSELSSRMVAARVRVAEPEANRPKTPKGYRDVFFIGHKVEKAKFHAARRGVAFTPEMEKSIRENPGKVFQYAEQAYKSKRP